MGEGVVPSQVFVSYGERKVKKLCSFMKTVKPYLHSDLYIVDDVILEMQKS